jgi:hypothetical protein
VFWNEASSSTEPGSISVNHLTHESVGSVTISVHFVPHRKHASLPWRRTG